METKNNSIYEVLDKLQQGYRERNSRGIASFVEELFTEKDGLVVVGTGLNEWACSRKEVEGLIKEQWNLENENFGLVDFKFMDARIIDRGDTVLVCSIANITRTISREAACDSTIEKLKIELSKEIEVKFKMNAIIREIAWTIKGIGKGNEYLNPMRFTAVLVKENGKYKFHQMQFSFDSCYMWQHRYLTEEDLLPIFKMENPINAAADIRKVLIKFQEGYTRRDVTYLDEYTEIFALNDDLITIGTDADEFFIGAEGLKKILVSDWKYWGDLKINVDGAVIVQNGNSAFFTTQAMIKMVIPEEKCNKFSIDDCKNNIDSKVMKSSEEKLLEILWNLTNNMYDREFGENYYAPMRFSGFLIKQNERWYIQHIQYSDYIDIPEKRI